MGIIHMIRAVVWEALCVLFWFGHDYMREGISPYSEIYQCTNCGKIKFAKMKWFEENEAVKDWKEFMVLEEDTMAHNHEV